MGTRYLAPVAALCSPGLVAGSGSRGDGALAVQATGSWTATASNDEPAVGPEVLVAGGGTGDVYSPATGAWTATGAMVFPFASAAAALLPTGQALSAGGRRVKYCGQYSCDEPIADAALFTP